MIKFPESGEWYVQVPDPIAPVLKKKNAEDEC